MTTTIFVLIILYGIYRWSVSWIEYYSKLDTRLGSSIWKYSYDYHVVGKRDVTLEDDKNLRDALSVAPNIKFMKYEISFKLSSF